MNESPESISLGSKEKSYCNEFLNLNVGMCDNLRTVGIMGLKVDIAVSRLRVNFCISDKTISTISHDDWPISIYLFRLF